MIRHPNGLARIRRRLELQAILNFVCAIGSWWSRVGTFTAYLGDSQRATRALMKDRPACESLHSDGRPGPRLERNIFGGVNFLDLPSTNSFTGEKGAGPASVALEHAGAAIVPHHEFGMVDANVHRSIPKLKCESCHIEKFDVKDAPYGRRGYV